MKVPSTKRLIGAYRAGDLTTAAISVPRLEVVRRGSVITFQEAKFDAIGVPQFTPNGDALTVTLTGVTSAGVDHLESAIFVVTWE
jgi:hypothetical protein